MFLTSISTDSISTPNMQEPLTVLIEGLLYSWSIYYKNPNIEYLKNQKLNTAGNTM